MVVEAKSRNSQCIQTSSIRYACRKWKGSLNVIKSIWDESTGFHTIGWIQIVIQPPKLLIQLMTWTLPMMIVFVLVSHFIRLLLYILILHHCTHPSFSCSSSSTTTTSPPRHFILKLWAATTAHWSDTACNTALFANGVCTSYDGTCSPTPGGIYFHKSFLADICKGKHFTLCWLWTPNTSWWRWSPSSPSIQPVFAA